MKHEIKPITPKFKLSAGQQGLAEINGIPHVDYGNNVWTPVDKIEDLPTSDGGYTRIDNDKSSGRPVVCHCGSDSFRISYGHYECVGTCTECGQSSTLYDG